MINLMDFFIHLDKHLNLIIETYGLWTYLILFLVIFLETGIVITPFLPGDSLLFAAGAYTAKGSLEVGWLFGLLCLAAIIGDTINYWIGYTVGWRAFQSRSRFLKREYLDRTHQFYERYGGKTIFLARFIPIIRTFAPFVAGIGRMAYGRFAFYNILGAIVWTGLFISGGHYFGQLPLVKDNFSLVILAIIVISVLPAIFEFLNNHYRRPGKVQDAIRVEGNDKS